MNIRIRYKNGETEVIVLKALKRDIAYEETGDIAKIYIQDELTHIINLSTISLIEFEGGEEWDS